MNEQTRAERTGESMARLHMDLITMWQTAGPEHVWDYLDKLNPDLVRTLIMAQVGADAQRF